MIPEVDKAIFIIICFAVSLGFACIAFKIKCDRDIEMAQIVSNCVGKNIPQSNSVTINKGLSIEKEGTVKWVYPKKDGKK